MIMMIIIIIIIILVTILSKVNVKAASMVNIGNSLVTEFLRCILSLYTINFLCGIFTALWMDIASLNKLVPQELLHIPG